MFKIEQGYLVEYVSIESNQAEVVRDNEPLDFHRLTGLLKSTIRKLIKRGNLKPFLGTITKAGWSKQNDDI